MAKHLSRRDIDYILYSITEWNMKSDKLTWDNLCKKVSRKIGKTPTRQSLYTHKEIVDLYMAKKKAIRQKVDLADKPSSIKKAYEKIDKLEIKVAELSNLNNILQENIAKLQYSCYLKGIKEHEIEENFPIIKR
ncbi:MULTISPECIES: hypothetical protein [Enterobacterales]|uniref:hypothetical protein n=1 Tax=Enterobacterales TaxID=91347 RepID=UPI000669A339|nr:MULTISPECIES: hypothetical protein [Enterobacteriaceae]EJY4981672.1 hypothetical protein [Salmonella enterica]QDI31802.1 hypothetical protein FG170_03855 [Serratia marcescens]EIF9757413.1 hypothetical protein [Escherichia coli]EKX2405531.1 hypothetical protein [Escherichia coli]MBC5099491.1 hypothetical protein [Klebsiella variicola]